MTALKYIRESNVATVKEILELKKNNPKDYDDLVVMAKEEMTLKGIQIEEPVAA
jgi:hypothetical protein